MSTLTAEEAARFLRINIKRVQSLARSGKLPASRVGRRWLFRKEELEALLARPNASPPARSLSLSARNRLRGIVSSVELDGLMAEVCVRIGDQELVSIITRSSAERLGIAVGVNVVAVIKSTEVMLGREEGES